MDEKAKKKIPIEEVHVLEKRAYERGYQKGYEDAKKENAKE